MRPTLLRPTLRNVVVHFQEQMRLIKASGDEDAFRQAQALKKLMLDLYFSLVNLDDVISYADWAGYMMLMISKCGGLVMRMKMMNHAFDLIYSLYNYMLPVYIGKVFDKYRPKYSSSRVTYKDVYDLSVEFSNTWGKLNEPFNRKRDSMTVEEVIQEIRDLKVPDCHPSESLPFRRPPLEDPDPHALVDGTQWYIVTLLWHYARISYYRMKSAGLVTYDFDVVFQNRDPPFPDSVFNHLFLKYEHVCGWLPVGEVGLFPQYYFEEKVGKTALTVSLRDLYKLIGTTATFPTRWKVEVSPPYGIFEVTNTTPDKGTQKVTPKLICPGKLVIDGSASSYCATASPNEDEYPTAAMDYVGGIMNEHGVYDIQHLIHYDLPQADKPLYNHEEMEPWLVRDCNFLAYGRNGYQTLVDNGFYMYEHIKNGVFTRPEHPPEELMGHLQCLQDLKQFHFFKGLFEKGSQDPTGGLFSQACVDYCNKHDPIHHRQGKDWVTWSVEFMSQQNREVLINDKRLFASEPVSENKSVVFKGEHYRVLASGTVCYAYTHTGEPLTFPAKYCENLDDNALPWECYKNIMAGFHLNQENYTIQLPVLSLSPNLSWRGHEIVHFDVSYWHKQLGHASLRSLKKYISVIKGMPPLLWPFRIRCEECYGKDEPKEDVPREDVDCI